MSTDIPGNWHDKPSPLSKKTPLSKQPDIDDLIRSLVWNFEWADKEHDIAKLKTALYHRLAAEADLEAYDYMDGKYVKALPLSKLKAIMEIKE